MLRDVIFALGIACTVAPYWLEHWYLPGTRLSNWPWHPAFPGRLKLAGLAGVAFYAIAALLGASPGLGYWLIASVALSRMLLVRWHTGRLARVGPADR